MVKARTMCKTMKKKGGGTIRRKVRISASGKWKFVKGTCSKARKKVTRRRKTKRKTTKRRRRR